MNKNTNTDSLRHSTGTEHPPITHARTFESEE
jgi:hypothetical protein